MVRRTFAGRITGALAAFFLGRRIAPGQVAIRSKPDQKPQIIVRVNPLAVPRTTEKSKPHG